MTNKSPILVTGAAGSIGSVGRKIVELLLQHNLPTRALVHRIDERSKALRDLGAEIVVADLTNSKEVVAAIEGCQRMYFGMSVSASYLNATVIAAAAAKQLPDFEVLVNISQMTVSQMTLTESTGSPQHEQHWLAEQVLNWSGLPVVHVRPTVFLEHPFFTTLAASSIARDGTICLPFGSAHTSPVATEDVANVIATVLINPAVHIGKIYELTGAKSQDMYAIAQEYSLALHRPVKYVDVPFDAWRDNELRSLGLPIHVYEHLLTMAKLHANNQYDRLTDDVLKLTGRPSTSIQDFVINNPVFAKLRIAN